MNINQKSYVVDDLLGISAEKFNNLVGLSYYKKSAEGNFQKISWLDRDYPWLYQKIINFFSRVFSSIRLGAKVTDYMLKKRLVKAAKQVELTPEQKKILMSLAENFRLHAGPEDSQLNQIALAGYIVTKKHLREENKKLQENVDELQKTQKNRSGEISDLKDKISELEDKIEKKSNAIKQKVDEIKTELDYEKLFKEVSGLKKQKSSMESETTGENQSKHTEEQSIKKLAAMQEKIAKLESKLVKKKASNQESLKKTDALKAEIKLLKADKASLEEERLGLEIESQNLQKECNTLQERLESVETEQEYQKQPESLTNTIEEVTRFLTIDELEEILSSEKTETALDEGMEETLPLKETESVEYIQEELKLLKEEQHLLDEEIDLLNQKLLNTDTDQIQLRNRLEEEITEKTEEAYDLYDQIQELESKREKFLQESEQPKTLVTSNQLEVSSIPESSDAVPKNEFNKSKTLIPKNIDSEVLKALFKKTEEKSTFDMFTDLFEELGGDVQNVTPPSKESRPSNIQVRLPKLSNDSLLEGLKNFKLTKGENPPQPKLEETNPLQTKLDAKFKKYDSDDDSDFEDD